MSATAAQPALPVPVPPGARHDRAVVALLAAGLAALWLPTLWDLTLGVAAEYGQGHEALFVAVSAWLLVGRREVLLANPPARRGGAMALFVLGLLMYVFGRSQQLLRVEIVSLIVVLAALLCFAGGLKALRASAFPLFFLLFIVPLPYAVVLAVTGPLKMAVSAAATQLLHWTGLPVARSGVVVTIGQYQLLVSEACAGLQTMFTLEAMGLLYATLRAGGSGLLNTLLALLVVPVSFCANVVRVVILMLVTYAFGDAVGQGFVHGFAGLVLFGVALALIFSLDVALRRWVVPKAVPEGSR